MDLKFIITNTKKLKKKNLLSPNHILYNSSYEYEQTRIGLFFSLYLKAMITAIGLCLLTIILCHNEPKPKQMVPFSIYAIIIIIAVLSYCYILCQKPYKSYKLYLKQREKIKNFILKNPSYKTMYGQWTYLTQIKKNKSFNELIINEVHYTLLIQYPSYIKRLESNMESTLSRELTIIITETINDTCDQLHHAYIKNRKAKI